jgi:hypothetical protein
MTLTVAPTYDTQPPARLRKVLASKADITSDTLHTGGMDMDMETVALPEVPAGVREAARQAGGGWLDVVVGAHQGLPPPRFVKGSWRLDENGELTGEYVANENYGRALPVRGGCPYGHGSAS